jgi:asparagine synthase (glutamine-hydrolysing)
LLNQILYLDIKLYMEGDILFKVDRASMSCSLETRVPLLNHSLVEFVLGLPLHMKLRGLNTKYLLKRSMRSLLPREIIHRPKKGFNIPVARWISDELRELVLDLLSEERLRRQGLFEFAYVHRLLDEHFTRQRDNRKPLWTLLAFQLWYERYIEKGM